MLFLITLVLAWLFVTPVANFTPPQAKEPDINVSSNIARDEPPLFQNTAPGGPADFSWIKRWAAIGDSFTAGIGAGQLYSESKSDRDCSRYDRSYAAVMYRRFGPSVKLFENVACTGARSTGILQQAQDLPKDLDLVVMTAGGNDLCLVCVPLLSQR